MLHERQRQEIPVKVLQRLLRTRVGEGTRDVPIKNIVNGEMKAMAPWTGPPAPGHTPESPAPLKIPDGGRLKATPLGSGPGSGAFGSSFHGWSSDSVLSDEALLLGLILVGVESLDSRIPVPLRPSLGLTHMQALRLSAKRDSSRRRGVSYRR